MSHRLDVQYAVDDGDAEPPSSRQLRVWVEAALREHRPDAELTVRIVGKPEIQALNRDYRHQDVPTNVLSFPFEAPAGIEMPLLGDVVICADVVAREASQSGRPLHAHWAHMVVHGVLHLLGYDHIEDHDAREMEAQETRILAELGYPDPYTH